MGVSLSPDLVGISQYGIQQRSEARVPNTIARSFAPARTKRSSDPMLYWPIGDASFTLFLLVAYARHAL